MGRKLLGGCVAALPVAFLVALGLGGYFDRSPLRYRPADSPEKGAPLPDLVAIYFSGDMGFAPFSAGPAVVAALRRRGVSVLTVNSSALFRRQRDRTYVDGLVGDVMRQARMHSGAARVALIGSAFGAGILDTGLGAIPPDLRRRIASVVLLGPGTRVYFHAHPGGLAYYGEPDSDPRRTARMLHGLNLTCIFSRRETVSLCNTPELASAKHIEIAGAGTLPGRYSQLAEIVAGAAITPPEPLR